MNHRSIIVMLLVALGPLMTTRASAVYQMGAGRWLTRDPLRYVDGPNMYEYVASNPGILRDPQGTDICNPGSNTKPILACGNNKDGTWRYCILIFPGQCCTTALPAGIPDVDCDFFFIPGKGWFKCAPGLIEQDCDPTEGGAPDGNRPWVPGDSPLRRWNEPLWPGVDDPFSGCAQICTIEANTPNGFSCKAYDQCMWRCLQAAESPYITWPPCSSPTPAAPIVPYRPRDPALNPPWQSSMRNAYMTDS